MMEKKNQTYLGDTEFRCLWVVAKALTMPPTPIQLISISLSLELIFLSGPYTILVAACLFKLMNGCDNHCCIFKHTKSVANNIKAAAGWQYEHTFQRDIIWWMSVKIKNWGGNASAKELERVHPEWCKRDPKRKLSCTDPPVWVNPPTGWFLLLIRSGSALIYCRVISLATFSPATPWKKRKRGKRLLYFTANLL